MLRHAIRIAHLARRNEPRTRAELTRTRGAYRASASSASSVAWACGGDIGLFTASQRVDIERERLDRRLVQLLAPCPHHAVMRVGDLRDHSVAAALIEMDVRGEPRSADVAIALVHQP